MKRWLVAFSVLIAAALPQAASALECPHGPTLNSTIEEGIKLCTSALARPMGTWVPGIGVLRNSPESHAENYVNRGLLYEWNGQNDLAIEDFTSALRWLGSDSTIYAARGDAYAATGAKDKAAADYAAAQRLGGDEAYSFATSCWRRVTRGWPLDLALADCNRALQIRTDAAIIWTERGFVNYRLRNYAAAIADCDAALKINRRLASSLYIRGLSKLGSGDAAGGQADIAAAKDANYRIAEAYALYGVKPDATEAAPAAPSNSDAR